MNTARFLKYVWPFYNITHERAKVSGWVLSSWSLLSAQSVILIGQDGLKNFDLKHELKFWWCKACNRNIRSSLKYLIGKKFVEEKWQNLWLGDENFPRRNIYPTNIFARWIFLPYECYPIINISGGKWRYFLIPPHEYSIEHPDFKVDCNWSWLD